MITASGASGLRSLLSSYFQRGIPRRQDVTVAAGTGAPQCTFINIDLPEHNDSNNTCHKQRCWRGWPRQHAHHHQKTTRVSTKRQTYLYRKLLCAGRSPVRNMDEYLLTSRSYRSPGRAMELRPWGPCGHSSPCDGRGGVFFGDIQAFCTASCDRTNQRATATTWASPAQITVFRKVFRTVLH